MNRTLLTLAFSVALVTGAVPAAAQQAVNPIHPAFQPLDAAGKPATQTEQVSLEKTCGACHDAAWIANPQHTGHAAAPGRTSGPGATCAQCHVDGGRLEVTPALLDAGGRLRREALRIGAPRAQSCARCHGLVTDGHAPVVLPADLAAPAEGRTYRLTLGEGAILSPERMSASFLALEGKDALDAPWDVHAAKLVDCTACHFAGNDPARADPKQPALRYLTADPRRLSRAEFLVRPDHRLGKASCRTCHDARKAHAFLPYRERHIDVLACEACHLAAPRAPVLEQLDATVATRDGRPVLRFRNLAPVPGEPLGAAEIRPFQPLLAERAEADGARRLAPVNLVTRYRWVAGPARAEVPFERVAAALVQGGTWRPEALAALDADHDGVLSERELVLDTPAKVAFVAGELRAAGVVEPAIAGELQVIPLAHGVSTRTQALRDCGACHGARSRLTAPFAVASVLPGGVPPAPPPDGGSVQLAGTLAPSTGGGLALLREQGVAPAGLHVLGHSRQGLTNTLGLVIFLLTAAAVVLHGLARWILRRRAAPAPHAPEREEYAFGRYERLWHWTMAISGAVLIATGLSIHLGAGGGLPIVVALHNAFAVVLMVNAFLALFYHLATAAIRTFIPEPGGMLGRILVHLEWQARGIFRGPAHHPDEPGHKLNPLQQLTYLALLNLLFPLQIGTGLLLWAAGHWPSVAAAMGGLSVLAPVHDLGAWLFLTFLVLHLYLVTTGRTPTEHLGSMITGWRRVPAVEVELRSTHVEATGVPQERS